MKIIYIYIYRERERDKESEKGEREESKRKEKFYNHESGYKSCKPLFIFRFFASLSPFLHQQRH